MRARCTKCDGTGIVERTYLEMTVNRDLVDQTPRSVWQEYFAAGYTWHEAVREELSYGDQS